MNTRLMVRMAFREGEWLTPYELQRSILDRYGHRMSDASVTARMRDLRKTKFGGYTVDRRPREGTRSFEYRLKRPTPQQELAL